MRPSRLTPQRRRSRTALRVGVARAALAVVLAVAVAVAVSFAVDAFAAESHSTTGDIVAFGPKNAYVSIAHDAIPGYMGAMTMSFEPRRPAQLEGLAVGNHVAFTFTATDDGRRFLDQIRPQAK